MKQGENQRICLCLSAARLSDYPEAADPSLHSAAEAEKLNLSIHLWEYNWHFINATDGVIHKVQAY